MTTRTQKIIGWIPAVLVAVFMIVASGLPKLFMADGTETAEFMKQLGAWDIRYIVGVMEILFAILFLIPRTSTVGFILLIGLLGGAMATGLTHDVPGNWPWFPLVIIGLMMVSAWFRNPELLSRLFKRPVPAKV